MIMITSGGITIMGSALAPQTLLRLMAWMSPAFPVGAFSYSHGLERAVHDGLVTDREDLETWLADLLTIGSAWNDAVLFAESWRQSHDGPALMQLADLGEAMAGSSERHLETMKQGAAFLQAARAWPDPVFDHLPDPCPFPVAAGAVSGAHDLALVAALSAWLHAFATNQVQAGLRLLPLGQQEGVEIIAALERTIAATARHTAMTSLEDLGSATVLAEIASLNHETQYSRLFRS
ncbi:MAG: urease accessory protein UreF [Alphaproteobacteria bacterium]|nr:urease accessory protein UreF [Alphaproteobacteria bacterium]